MAPCSDGKRAASHATIAVTAPTASLTQIYDRRFSDKERLAFGRFAHLNVRNGHFVDIAVQGHLANSSRATSLSRPLSGQSSERASGLKQKPRRASEPNLKALSPGDGPHMRTALQNSSFQPRSPTEQSLEVTLAGSPPRAEPPSEHKPSLDQSRLQCVLEQLLPAEDLPSTLHAEQGNQSVNQDTSALSVASSARNRTPGARSRYETSPAGVDGCRAALQRRNRRDSTLAARVSTPASDGGTELAPARSLKRSRTMRSRRQVLEHFRWRLLQRFRSLFDAFERLHDLGTRENALAQDEFCQLFSQLGVKESEALEIFWTMNCKGKEMASLAELRTALAGTSKEALLWELRCRLLTQGITPNDLTKVKKILEIARRPRHRTVRQRRRQPAGRSVPGLFRAAAVDSYEGLNLEASVEDSEYEWGTKGDASNTWVDNFESSTGFLPSSSRLSRGDWVQVCAAIGLTLVEAERLFPILVDSATGMVDLQEMFTTLRADVAPHVSLERFATRVLTRFGSLQSAFASVCGAGAASAETGSTSVAASLPPAFAPEQVMHWLEFYALAVALEVKDSNAERIWAALTHAQRNVETGNIHRESGAASENTEESGIVSDVAMPAGPTAETPGEAKTAPNLVEEVEGVTEKIFVQELTMWAPGTALCALRNQVDEHFKDLGELRHALGQTGSVLSAPVTPAELDGALLAVGIPGCNVERVCSAVQSAWRGGLKGDAITLDDVVEALRRNGAVHGSAAQSAVRDDLRPFWQKFQNMQADLYGESEVGGQQSHETGHLRASSSLPLLKSDVALRSRSVRHSQCRRAAPCLS